MSGGFTMTTGDLDEIFTHIKQLKQQKTTAHNTTTSKDKKGMFAGDKDVFHETESSNTPLSLSKDESSGDTREASLAFTSPVDRLNKDHGVSHPSDSHQLTSQDQPPTLDLELSDAAPLSITQSQVEPSASLAQRWDDTSVVTCDICSTPMILGRNLSGLVVDDHFFACESCCKNISKTKLVDWTKSRMQRPGKVRSIGIWVTEHINKHR